MASIRAARAVLGVATMIGLALSHAPARADDGASAEQLFQEANKLVAKGDYEHACPKLEGSLRLEPAVGTQFNLADCYEHIGRIASAWTMFRDVATIARAAGKFERERIALQRASAIEAKVGRLEIVARAPAPGLEIRVDGRELARDQWKGFAIDAGEHELLASAPNRTTWRGRATSRDSATTSITVPELVDPTPKPAPVVAVPERSSSPQKTIALVLGGVGIVAAGVGAVSGAMALSSRSDGQRDCPKDIYQFRCPTAEGADAWNSATTAGNVSTVAFIVAGVALAGAAVLWLTAPNSKPRTTATWLGGQF